MIRGMQINSRNCITGKWKVSVGIRNWMEMEDKQFHLGSRWLPQQSNWGNNAKGRKFQSGSELSEYAGEVFLSHASTVSKPMLSVFQELLPLT